MSAPTPTPAPPLPAPRRVVSGLTPAGQSTIAFDSPVAMELSDNDGNRMNVGQVWATRESPANVQTGVDEALEKVETIVAPGESLGVGVGEGEDVGWVADSGAIRLSCL